MAIQYDFARTQVPAPSDPTKKVYVDQRLLQGADWIVPFRLTRIVAGVSEPVNLTTDVSDIRMQVRTSKAAATTIIDANLGNSQFVVTDGPAGEFELRVLAAVTELITVPAKKAVHDLEIVYILPAVRTKRWLEGLVDVSKNVTR